MKKQWLSIPPSVYVSFKKNAILLFDTITGEYLISECLFFKRLIKKMYSPASMGVVDMHISMEKYADVSAGLSKKLLTMELSEDKPVVFLPYLKIIRDLSELDNKKYSDVELYVPTYLSQLNLFLTQSEIFGECYSYYNNIQRQIVAPLYAKKKIVMSVELLDKILFETCITSVKNINIFISGEQDVLILFSALPSMLRRHSYTYKIFMYLKQWQQIKEKWPLKNIDLEILATPKEIEQYLRVSLLSNYISTIHFLIENENDYKLAMNLEKEISMYCKYEYHPIYTGSNDDFFLQHVFLSKEDILERNFTMEKVFKHQRLNSNFFGSLNVYPNGIVKASLHTKSLGNLHKDTLLNLIKKELVNNTAWRKIRNKRPCNICLYQFLCPSPSNYEYVLKRNLCLVEHIDTTNKNKYYR